MVTQSGWFGLVEPKSGLGIRRTDLKVRHYIRKAGLGENPDPETHRERHAGFGLMACACE